MCDYKIIIEIDGMQHFIEIPHFNNSSLEYNIHNDNMKNKLAVKHGYKIIRISYSELDNAEDIIDTVINCKGFIDNICHIGIEYKKYLEKFE